MSDVPWDFSEEQVGKMFPDLPEEDRAEAAGNYSQYFQVLARIYDDLGDKGNLKEVMLRLQYEKRNRNKLASQNESDQNDDTSTPKGESNEFNS